MAGKEGGVWTYSIISQWAYYQLKAYSPKEWLTSYNLVGAEFPLASNGVFLAYDNFFKIHNVSPQNKSLKAMQAEFNMNLPHDNFGQNGFSFQHNIILPV